MAFNEKYVTVTGGGLHDGSSEANAWTLAEAYSNAASGQRLNIKAGTYTVSGTWSVWPSSSASSPFSFRGYKTNIGDLDTKPTSQLVDGTDRPLIQTTNSSNYLLITQSNALFENIAFESTVGRPSIYARSGRSIYKRCKFIAPSSGGASSIPAIEFGANYQCFYLCHFDGSGSTINQVVNKSSQLIGCLIENFSSWSMNEFLQLSNCVIRNFSGVAITVGGYGWMNMSGNTFYNISSHALQMPTSSTYPNVAANVIHNNVFHTIGGDAISSGGNYFEAFYDNNLFYNITGSNYSNTFNLNRNAISESSDPFVDAAGEDYSLVSSSGGYGKAQPNPFEGLDADSRRDIGAIQHADPASGGGATVHPLYAN
jgi:hypothetical protein